MARTVELEIRLRPKNQLTLPERVAQLLGAQPGDRFVVSLDDEHPNRVELRRLPTSYAGVLADVFGDEEDAAEYVRGERASWEE